MDMLLVLLGLGSLIAMVVGLIKPGLVIRWGEKKTRPRVLMIYGGLFIVLFITLGMTVTPNSEKASSKAIIKAEEPQAKPAKEAASKESDVKYSYADVEKRVSDWLGEHEFPGISKLSLSPGKADKSLYETDGKKYHLIILKGLRRDADILVDPYSGEMFFHDVGLKPQPIIKWYLEYRKSHDADSQNRIDENFEWVEKPSVKNGAIVGKVKNISKDQFVNCIIEFNLYDANKNQLSSLAIGQVRNLKAGNVWSFSVPIIFDNVASYEFQSVKGYTW